MEDRAGARGLRERDRRPPPAGRLLVAAVFVASSLSTARAAIVAAEVRTGQQLQDAIAAKSPFIHISSHVNLTGVNAGTPYENSVIFPDDPGDVAIWGECVASTLPEEVQAYSAAHVLGYDLAQSGPCSIYTQSLSLNGSVTLRDVAALRVPGGGRLLLANVIVSTAGAAAADSTSSAAAAALPSAAFGISVAQGVQLWLIESVVAFFQQANVLSVDSHVYSIWSWTYQVGPATGSPQVAVAFLQQSDQIFGAQQLTLYSYGSVFHYDNLPNLGPVYVGPLWTDADGSVVFGTSNSSLKTSPRIVLDETYKHIHLSQQSDCVGICICAPGVSQPQLFLNETNDPANNFIALTPQENRNCSGSPPPVTQPIDSIDWESLYPPGTDEWAAALLQAGIEYADYMQNPSYDNAPVEGAGSGGGGGGGGLGTGAIIGISAGGGAFVLALAATLLLLCCCYRRGRRARRNAEAKAAELKIDAPPAQFYAIDPAMYHPPPQHHGALQLYAQHSDFGGSQSDGGPPGGSHSGFAASRSGSGRHAHSAGGASEGERFYRTPGDAPKRVSRHKSLDAPAHAPTCCDPRLSVHSADGPGRSDPGSTTLAAFDRSQTLGSQNDSAASGANASVAMTSFESITRKREVYGMRVKVDFTFIDSLLDEAERQWGGELFGRYLSLGPSKRSYGGQGMVQFALLKFNTDKKVAIKLYASNSAFKNEQALYSNHLLHHLLPPIDDAGSNEDRRYVDPLGRAFPPFVVMEKGQPLDHFWRRCRPNFTTCVQIIHHLVRRVAELHSYGICHRDIKPANTIWLPSRNEWSLIDFGSSATIGRPADLSFSRDYAAPESIQAQLDGVQQVFADAAVDVWALGVMSIELLTGRKAIHPQDTGSQLDDLVIEVMTGVQPLFWEVPANMAHLRRKMGFMGDQLLQMVRRRPEERPTLKDVDVAWRQVLQEGTSTLV